MSAPPRNKVESIAILKQKHPPYSRTQLLTLNISDITERNSFASYLNINVAASPSDFTLIYMKNT